jgi:lipopolysaccharide/colanic/teichoic acid biosynthesis glycosyltransferase
LTFVFAIPASQNDASAESFIERGSKDHVPWEETVNTGRQGRQINVINAISEPVLERRALNEEDFRRVIAIERKRTERSKAPFVLMLLEVASQNEEKTAPALESVVSILLATSRDTDLVGWYKSGKTIGALFTGLAPEDKSSILMTILSRATNTLRDELSFEQFNLINISLHYYPDDWDENGPGRPSNPALYPDLSKQASGKQPLLVLKRSIDIVGGILLSLICLPFCVLIAIAIKATSKGPILFRQMRVGQHGKQFVFLKFRSMYTDNDHSVHREYVTKLINNDAKAGSTLSTDVVYKLTGDKRITPIGRFLRRTSLDELPQFLNVLQGDMSLVGPRPPIPYELAAYQTWHRRRLLEVKPGVTGLWQVTGRSRVDFDSMVRLDLKYATSWNPWLDIKILLRTPLAVIRGSGAY